jgi:hypothetical protein
MFYELNLRRYVPYAVLITLRRAAPNREPPVQRRDANPNPNRTAVTPPPANGSCAHSLSPHARDLDRSAIDVGSLPATISGRRREQRGARVTATARHS